MLIDFIINEMLGTLISARISTVSAVQLTSWITPTFLSQYDD